MHVIVSIFFAFLVAGYAFAEGITAPIENCLPPTADGTQNLDKCSLSYRPPPPLREHVKVDNCQFLPGQAEVGAENSYKLMQCSVSNRSNEPIESLSYGVRYFRGDRQEPLIEAGFTKQHRFSTANIDGSLQPGDERELNFAGPAIPSGIATSQLTVAIEVIGVYAPGSRMLR